MERIVRKNKLPVQVFHIKQNFTLTIKDLSVSLEQWQLDLFLYRCDEPDRKRKGKNDASLYKLFS